MRYYLLFILCFLSLAATAKGKHLVPYRQGDKWGLSDKNGTIVIPCRYKNIAYHYPFVFATDNSRIHPVKIMDDKGRVIDSCFQYYASACDNRHFVFNYAQATDSTHHFRLTAFSSGFQQLHLRKLVNWSIFPGPVTAYTLLPDKSKKAIPGIIDAIATSVGLVATTVNGKAGIYYFCNDSFVIKPEYNSITFKNPDVLLAQKDNEFIPFGHDGTRYDFHVDTNAIYINKEHRNYITVALLTPGANTDYRSVGYRLVNHEGKTLIAPERTWEYGEHSHEYIRLRKPKSDLKSGERVFQLANLDGDIVVPSAQEIENLYNGIFKITDIGPGMRNEMMYSAETGKIILTRTKEDKEPIESIGLPTAIKDGVRYYYDNKGAVLAGIPDTVMKAQGAANLAKKLQIRAGSAIYRATGLLFRVYYAFRKDTATSFELYDQSFTKLGLAYEQIIKIEYTDGYASVKKDGKWGLVNVHFKEIVPAIYDYPLVIRADRATGITGDKRVFIDLSSLKTVNASRFDDIDKGSFENKRLAVKYIPKGIHNDYTSRQKIMVQTLYLTDTSGNIIDSAVKNDTKSYKYSFCGNGKILKYSSTSVSDGDTYLMNNLRDTGKRSPYTVDNIYYSSDKALLIEYYDNTQKPGLLSANDFSIVVPAGKYDRGYATSYNISSTDTTDAPLEVMLIEGEIRNPADDTNNMFKTMQQMQLGGPPVDTEPKRQQIGYYSLSGRKYWDK